MDYEGLIKEAFEARKNSYAPYSNYHVGAALLCEDGSISRGCNVENASYGATNCAERSAVFAAVSSGKRRFCAIAIVGGTGFDDHTDDSATPCGICRQVLREFCDPKEFKVVIAKSINDYRIFTLEELLPESFGPDNLNKGE